MRKGLLCLLLPPILSSCFGGRRDRIERRADTYGSSATAGSRRCVEKWGARRDAGRPLRCDINTTRWFEQFVCHQYLSAARAGHHPSSCAQQAVPTRTAPDGTPHRARPPRAPRPLRVRATRPRWRSAGSSRSLVVARSRGSPARARSQRRSRRRAITTVMIFSSSSTVIIIPPAVARAPSSSRRSRSSRRRLRRRPRRPPARGPRAASPPRRARPAPPPRRPPGPPGPPPRPPPPTPRSPS